jgi:hypothetical protein
MAVGSVGRSNESGRGEEEDALMAADDNQIKVATAMADSTVTATTTATATATAMAQRRQQQQSTTSGSKRNGGGGCGNGSGGGNGGDGGGNCGCSDGSRYSAPVKSRGDRCSNSNHHCQVTAATTTISAAAMDAMVKVQVVGRSILG